MEQERLTPELITNASLWRLALEIRQQCIEVVIHSLLHDNSLIRRTIAVDTAIDPITALSNAVYDNPLLLSDFGKVDILIDTPRMMLVPNDLQSDDARQGVMETLWRTNDYTVIADQIAHSDDMLLMGVDDKVLSFLRRTFPLARISHRLAPITRYFYNKDRLNSASRMYVHLLKDAVDVLYIKNGQIRVVNTFAAPSPDDALYFIMAVIKTAGFSTEDDNLMVCGLPKVREKVISELRKYVNHVMPVLFPSTLLTMGTDALSAPFELIILPLCE